MGERPPPLTALTLNVVLEYISPPENLPIPTYLLSKDLLKRHHFLSITPNDPLQYLSWPSDSDQPDANIIPRLDQLAADRHSQPVIRYSSDADSVLAHVHVSGSENDGLRLVFQYELTDASGGGAWKYHNAACMPFPKGCQTSVPNLGHETKEPASISQDVDDDEDSDYWNAYGNDPDDQEHAVPARSKVATPGDSEDAYWAQYSAVQGSGDSTRPSPLSKRKALQRMHSDGAPDAFIQHTNANGFQLRDFKLQPPSPRELNALLSTVSPRTFNESLPLEDQPESLVEDPAVAETPSAAKIGSSNAPLPPNGSLLLGSDSADSALKTSVQGLYHLWLGGKPDASSLRETFLLLVRNSIQA